MEYYGLDFNGFKSKILLKLNYSNNCLDSIMNIFLKCSFFCKILYLNLRYNLIMLGLGYDKWSFVISPALTQHISHIRGGLPGWKKSYLKCYKSPEPPTFKKSEASLIEIGPWGNQKYIEKHFGTQIVHIFPSYVLLCGYFMIFPKTVLNLMRIGVLISTQCL